MSVGFRHICIFGLLWAAFGVPAFAQVFTVNPVDQELLIGEQTQVHVRLQGNPSDNVIWPVFTDTLGKHIEVVSVSGMDTTENAAENTRLLEQVITITSFDSGLWSASSIAITVNGNVLRSDPFLVSVTTIEVDTTQAIKDIKPPYDIPYTWREIAFIVAKYMGIVWAVLAVLAVIVYLVGNDPKRLLTGSAKAEPAIPPHERGLRALRDIEAGELWQKGQFKAYHIAWSDVIRNYLEEQFSLQALESTTDEIARQLRNVPLEEPLKSRLVEALRISDLAKFAKATPLASENVFCMTAAVDVIEQTAPRETEEEPDPDVADETENP